MSVDNLSVIDYITEKDNTVILTISDHLQWDEESDHLFLLQEKINAYLMAIESGQLVSKYPASIGKQVSISVAMKYDPNDIGRLFLLRVKEALLKVGYGFSYYVVT